MLLVSVGTGSAPKVGPAFEHPDQSIPFQIPGLISALMHSAEVDQDINCRTVGRCVYGNVIDRELGDMIPRVGGECLYDLSFEERMARPRIPLEQDLGKAFLYARFNPELTAEELRKIGIGDVNIDELLRMDLATPENIKKLRDVGEAAGNLIEPAYFGAFVRQSKV